MVLFLRSIIQESLVWIVIGILCEMFLWLVCIDEEHDAERDGPRRNPLLSLLPVDRLIMNKKIRGIDDELAIFIGYWGLFVFSYLCR